MSDYIEEKFVTPHGDDVELVEWCGYGDIKDWRHCIQCIVQKRNNCFRCNGNGCPVCENLTYNVKDA